LSPHPQPFSQMGEGRKPPSKRELIAKVLIWYSPAFVALVLAPLSTLASNSDQVSWKESRLVVAARPSFCRPPDKLPRDAAAERRCLWRTANLFRVRSRPFADRHR